MGSNGCVTNWQCNAGSGNNSQLPVAQLSCQPKVADSGMTISFSFACTNANASSGNGFDTVGALSGTSTAVVQQPADGSNTVSYGLTCTKGSGASMLSSSAQCAVQTGKPSIMLVSTPERVQNGRQANIGWVTSGQQSCVISNPDYTDWTAQNAANTSIAGAVTTPVITHDTTFTLTCKTVGGASQTSSVKLFVI